MSPTIYNLGDAVHREKMAAFDYDWTLVSPKGGKTFPSRIDDWEWLYPGIPAKIKSYYEDGFMIVIFTNQSKAWKHEQIRLVAKTLDIPVFIVVATDKSDYKPNPILFNVLVGNSKINKEKSFFVGDALGRRSDFSDSDKVFAENIGVPCYCPEQVFHMRDLQ
jgi:bifunctional polynucleotide phosphatase/kinase